MTPLEGETNVEKVREQAIAFYDQEHNLSSEDRKQLYVFFEQQCRRMLLGFSVGVAIGTAVPFFVRKKGSLVHPAFPIIGAVLGGSIVPGLVNNSIYKLQVEQFNEKFGENSPICQTIAKTPDPISKSVFWSNYFKKSSDDPNFRMKDPRTVVNSVKFFSLEDNPKIPPYGKPGYYKNDQAEPPATLNEQYLSHWDKIRSQNSTKRPDTDPNRQQYDSAQFSQSTQPININDDIFETSTSNSTYLPPTPSRSIGDSYDSNESNDNDLNRNYPKQEDHDIFKLDNDHLIKDQGATGNSWEKIRQNSKHD